MTRHGRRSVDVLMERASAALSATSYFEAEALAMRALDAARRARDYATLARIVLPLQEARRQIRQRACDEPGVRLAAGRSALRSGPRPGCVLVCPPLLGIDGMRYRERAFGANVPVMVLTREPMPRSGPHQGLWPIVAVGIHRPDSLLRPGPSDMVTLRTYVQPPPGTQPDPASPTHDRLAGPIDQSWFVAAQEALGDAAIASLRDDEPPAVRVDRLLDMLQALPDHEKLMQRLERECREALLAPVVERPWIRMDALRA